MQNDRTFPTFAYSSHVPLEPLSPPQTLSYFDPAALGRGFDSLNGVVKTYVLPRQDQETPKDLDSAGKSFSYYIHLVEDSSKLKKVLELSLNASYGGTSGSVSYLSDIETNTSSLCLIAQMTVELAPTIVKETRADLSVIKDLRTKTVRDVYQIIGDQYIDSITYGGNLFILLTMQAVDESDKERLSIQIKGSYGPFAAEASFKSTLERISKHQEINMRVVGAGINPTVVETYEEAMKLMNALGQLQKPYPIRFHVNPITDILVGSGLSSSEVPRLGKSFEWLQKASEVYDLLTKYIATWKHMQRLHEDGAVVLSYDFDAETAKRALNEASKRQEELERVVKVVQNSIAPSLPDPTRYLMGLQNLPDRKRLPEGMPKLSGTIYTNGEKAHSLPDHGDWFTCESPSFGAVCANWIVGIEFNLDTPEEELCIEYKGVQRNFDKSTAETEWLRNPSRLGVPNYSGSIFDNRLEQLSFRLTGTRAGLYKVAFEIQNFLYNPSGIHGLEEGEDPEKFVPEKNPSEPIIAMRIRLLPA